MLEIMPPGTWWPYMRLIVFHRLADRQAVSLGHGGEMSHHRFERFQIDLQDA